jgi:hypothetical protein
MLLGGVLLWAGAARADISSTNPAAIVVFPKIVVDTSNGYDTVIQLTNTDAINPVNVRCFYVNANGHCSTSGIICDPGLVNPDPLCSPTERCVPGWIETDFTFRLTPGQPIGWTASLGLPNLLLSDTPGPGGQFNTGSIPPVNEDPMIGELKCVEVGDDELPVESNDLKGEATIEGFSASPAYADIDGYNAIGIEAIHGANNRDNTLVLGQEYNGCPNYLFLDHFFDGAEEPALGDTVYTALTLVPCSEDFNTQLPLKTTVQYLVYNEFEQRFSTSAPITCFSERYLSDIDTKVGNSNGNDASSIFHVAVEGTLTGQTTIRGVADSDTTHGHGLLAIAEEFHRHGSTTRTGAYVAVQRGTRSQNDVIYLPDATH